MKGLLTLISRLDYSEPGRWMWGCYLDEKAVVDYPVPVYRRRDAWILWGEIDGEKENGVAGVDGLGCVVLTLEVVVFGLF